MKKYYVIMSHSGQTLGFDVLARSEQVARNKAVKRAQFATGDKQITAGNIESVTYEGFYLARRYFQVNQQGV